MSGRVEEKSQVPPWRHELAGDYRGPNEAVLQEVTRAGSQLNRKVRNLSSTWGLSLTSLHTVYVHISACIRPLYVFYILTYP